MSDVRQFMLERLEAHGEHDEVLKLLLDCIEWAFVHGDCEVEDGIGTSYVQSLWYGRGKRDSNSYEQLFGLLGPNLRQSWDGSKTVVKLSYL